MHLFFRKIEKISTYMYTFSYKILALHFSCISKKIMNKVKSEVL